MKIEEEIKQKKFANEYQKMVVNILFTGSWLSSLSNKNLKPFGLSQEQYNILRILRGQYPNPSSIQLLMERMIDKSSNASRIVEKLRVKGLVERNECKKDRRLVDVLINEKGMILMKEIDKTFDTWESSFKSLTEDEAKTINGLLDKLRG